MNISCLHEKMERFVGRMSRMSGVSWVRKVTYVREWSEQTYQVEFSE